MEILQDNLLGVLVQALPAAIALPQFFGGRELVQTEAGFSLFVMTTAVVEHEAVAVGGKGEGYLEGFGVFQRLLHAGADAAQVALGLDDRDRDIGLDAQHDIGAPGPAARDQLAAHGDAALADLELFAHLQLNIPAGTRQRRQDVFRADVAFGKLLFVQVLFPFRFDRPIHVARAILPDSSGVGKFGDAGGRQKALDPGSSPGCTPEQQRGQREHRGEAGVQGHDDHDAGGRFQRRGSEQ